MRYRSFSDRRISAYGAVLIITLIGGIATLSIVHLINSIDFAYAQSTVL